MHSVYATITWSLNAAQPQPRSCSLETPFSGVVVGQFALCIMNLEFNCVTFVTSLSFPENTNVAVAGLHLKTKLSTLTY